MDQTRELMAGYGQAPGALQARGNSSDIVPERVLESFERRARAAAVNMAEVLGRLEVVADRLFAEKGSGPVRADGKSQPAPPVTGSFNGLDEALRRQEVAIADLTALTSRFEIV